MGRKSDLSAEKKTQILTLIKTGVYSFKEIASLSCVGKTSVAKIARLDKENVPVNQNQRNKCGSKKKTTERTERVLKAIVRQDRTATISSIKKKLEDLGVDISQRTVQRRLLQQGYRCRRATKKPLLDDRKKKNRQNFVRSFKNFTDNDWNKVKHQFTLFFFYFRKKLGFIHILNLNRYFSLTKVRCTFLVRTQNTSEDEKMKSWTLAASYQP